MSYDQTANTYKESSILGSRREQLVPLLYQHLLVNLRRAAKQMSAGDIEGKAASVEKATAILYELLGSLDFEAGEELASRLASLYSYFLKELAEASRTLDADRLNPIIEMISSLHESWVEAARIVAEERGNESARSTA